GPIITTRVEQEQLLTGLRIDRSDIGPFETIAVIASKSQVFAARWSAMLFRRDMVGFMRGDNEVLMDQAVLATPGSPLTHLKAKCRRDMPSAHIAERPCQSASAFHRESILSTSPLSSRSA